MKAVTTIPQVSLEKLAKYSRMFSYLMTSFTKTYGVIHDTTLTLYLKGNKSVVSLVLLLDVPVPDAIYFSIDINKFLSAAKKIGNIMPLKLLITTVPPQILMTSDATNDKISFSANFYEATSAEIAPLITFKQTYEPLFTTGETFNATPSFLDFSHIATTYMGTINKNNSIALFSDNLVYADRTVVVSMKTTVWQAPFKDPTTYRLLHKFILGFIDFIAPENTALCISTDGNFIRWESSIDPNFWAILAIDPCTISIPNQADLDAIIPEDNKVARVMVRPSRLAEAIDFFSGLFEASIWKPITFSWTNDSIAGTQKVILSYHHPSTEVEKELAVEAFNGNLATLGVTSTSFTLISDSLRILLNRMLDTGMLEIRFNDIAADAVHGAGIQLIYVDATNTVVYTAVLAKLSGD